jgi:hypothetical protein
VTTPFRSPTLLILLMGAALVGGACAPSSGALGTPATPVATPDPSGEPAPTDVTPATPAPTAIASSPPPAGSTAPASATPGPTRTPEPTPAGTTIVRAYFVLGSSTGNEGLVPVLREVPETAAVATAAMQALLAGPAGAELEASPAVVTAIPDGTTLNGVTIEDGIATVDLSPAFASGGGTTSMAARLAQVVYTLTQFPTVDAVLFELDGVPVRTFSSEGLLLDGPQARSDFRELLPAIFVDRPAWGAAAGNPVALSGIANVFEATFRVQVLDAKGTVLADEQVMASCGTGCWGTFKASLPYEIAKAQYGMLRVYEPSARDGSPVNVTEYRVWLTP